MRKDMLYSFLLAVLLQCHTGQTLECYSCLGDCNDMNTIQCDPNQQCMIRELKLHHGRREQQKGCLNAQMCNVALPDPSLTQFCCATNLCNRAMPSETTTIPTTSVAITNASTASSPSTTNAVVRPPGSPMMCYSCDYVCIQRSTVMCEAGHVCVTKKKTVAGVAFRKYGCANTTSCGKVNSDVEAGTTWAVKYDCCENNLCNSAVTARLPVISAIGAVLVIWLTKLSS